jgi:transglutaminase-like putative cysteine protease
MKYRLSITKALFLALLLFGASANTFGQTKKFGDVSTQDFTAYDSKYDSTMSAIVLFEKGEVRFDDEYNCIFEYHRRIKILNDDGFEYGDVEIPVRKDIEQDIYDIDAATYTLNENGSVSKNEIGRRDVFKEKVTDDVELEKFTLPALSPGSIIEYKYRKKVGNPFMLPDWTFHSYIPVQWSEYKMFIPNGLNYRMVFKGNDSLYIQEAKRIPGNSMGLGYQRTGGGQEIYLAKKDLPPVEDLPFMINRNDHLSEVITQLVNVRIQGIMMRDFNEDWDMIARNLNKRGDFGRQRTDGAIKDELETLISDDMDALTKVETVYNYIVNNFEWNGYHDVITEQGIRDAFELKKGSTGDINLLLVEMLREVGIQASPALISTRSNGSVLTDYPILHQFNMSVAVVELADRAFVLDASSGRRSYRFPNPKVLYRNALVVREDDSWGWLTTFPIDKTTEQRSFSYSLKDSSRIHASISGRVGGAYAENMRQEVNTINFNSYWEDELSELNGLEVDSSEFRNIGDLSGKISYTTHFSYEKNDGLMLDKDLIYFQPLQFLRTEENPFKKPDRKFPVEFSYPFTNQLMVRVEIPEGYEVDELPESKIYSLTNGGGLYRFDVSVMGGMINVVSSLSIQGISFPAEEYEEMKELFQAMIDSQNAMVVLKKTDSE